MTSRTSAILLALTSVLLWSTVATAFELSLEVLDPVGLLVLSSAASTLVLGVVLLVKGKAGAVLEGGARSLALSALAGFLNPFLYYMVLFRAYDLLPAQQAQPLNYTWPIVLSVLSVPLLGQRMSRRTILAVLASFSGVVVISTGGDLTGLTVESPLGVALATGSSLIWASYWILNLKDRRSEVVKLFLGFCFGTIYSLAWAVFSGGLPSLSLPAIAGASYVGAFEMGLTFVIWLKALGLAEKTSQVGILVFLSPFLSLVFISLVLHEPLRWATVAGLALIVGGILLEKLPRRDGARRADRP